MSEVPQGFLHEAAPKAPENAHYAQLHPSFHHNTYLIRRKILTIVGAVMKVYDEQMNLLFYIKMKAFKLKEDITIFADEERTQPLLRIRARHVIDFAATYDIYDVSTGQEYLLGALKRRGMKSLLRDEWDILGQSDQPVGQIMEDSGGLAAMRRVAGIVSILFPQKYDFSIQGYPVGFMKQNYNPFVMKLTADFTQDQHGYLDRRIAVAAATLLCVIEGKQS